MREEKELWESVQHSMDVSSSGVTALRSKVIVIAALRAVSSLTLRPAMAADVLLQVTQTAGLAECEVEGGSREGEDHLDARHVLLGSF